MEVLLDLVMMGEQGFVLHVEGVIGDSRLTFVYGKYGRGSKGHRRYGDPAASVGSDIGKKPMAPSMSLFLGLRGPEVYHHSFQSHDTMSKLSQK